VLPDQADARLSTDSVYGSYLDISGVSLKTVNEDDATGVRVCAFGTCKSGVILQNENDEVMCGQCTLHVSVIWLDTKWPGW
jgi:hypothetical protein